MSYQMDHIWEASSRLKNSPGFLIWSQCSRTLYRSFIVTLYIYIHTELEVLADLKIKFLIHLTNYQSISPFEYAQLSSPSPNPSPLSRKVLFVRISCYQPTQIKDAGEAYRIKDNIIKTFRSGCSQVPQGIKEVSQFPIGTKIQHSTGSSIITIR